MGEILLQEKPQELGLDMAIDLISLNVLLLPHLANTIFEHFGTKMQPKRKVQDLVLVGM